MPHSARHFPPKILAIVGIVVVIVLAGVAFTINNQPDRTAASIEQRIKGEDLNQSFTPDAQPTLPIQPAGSLCITNQTVTIPADYQVLMHGDNGALLLSNNMMIGLSQSDNPAADLINQLDPRGIVYTQNNDVFTYSIPNTYPQDYAIAQITDTFIVTVIYADPVTQIDATTMLNSSINSLQQGCYAS